MNGGQDLGGMMGFGPINPNPDEPMFHGEWERRVLALSLAMGATGMWNIDASRHSRETIPPANYLSWSYYRIWFEGLEKLLVQKNLVSANELATGKMVQPAITTKNKMVAAHVADALAAGSPASRTPTSTAKYQVGDQVRTINTNTKGHTRLARYLRAHIGEITHVHGTHVFPDTNAHFEGENPKWLYTVKFSAEELWGREKPTNDFVHADLFEPYLGPIK